MNQRGNSGTTRRVGEEKREMEGKGRIYIDRNYSPTPRLCLPHNTGSLPRHFSPFPVKLVPSPRISASTYTIVVHLTHRPDCCPTPKPLLSSSGHKIIHPVFALTINQSSSRISRSIHLKHGSPLTFPFLSHLTFTSPQLISSSCFPSSPHWMLRHTLNSSHVPTV